jgi:hypothetical protein
MSESKKELSDVTTVPAARQKEVQAGYPLK